MKARRLDELERLIASEDFDGWWADVERIRAELHEAEQRHAASLEEASLLEFRSEHAQKNGIDTLHAAGEAEDRAATLESEVQEIENQSMALVGTFEEQRIQASEAWMRSSAVEKSLEEAREALEAARAGNEDTARHEAEVARLIPEQRSAHEVYERESARKVRLWQDVEALWARSAQLGLIGAEQRAKSQRIKREAERLFQASERDKQRAKSLREEAEAASRRHEDRRKAFEAILQTAEDRFGAWVGDDFLFWQSQEDAKHAWCLSISEDAETYNVEVRPATLYDVTVKGGVARIEPLLPRDRASEAESDRRIEAWFLEGRIIKDDSVANDAGEATGS